MGGGGGGGGCLQCNSGVISRSLVSGLGRHKNDLFIIIINVIIAIIIINTFYNPFIKIYIGSSSRFSVLCKNKIK